MQLLSPTKPTATISTLRIVIAKQDRIYAEALGSVCAQVYPLAEVQTYRRGRMALAALQAQPADFLVLGLTYQDMDGMELLRQVGQEDLAKHVLVVAETRDEFLIPSLQTARVDAILDTGSESLDTVREALRLVQSGNVYISPTLHVYLVKRSPIRQIHAELTPSELRVLRIIGTGQDNQEAAQALGLSVSTIQTHRRNIMHKLKVPTSAKLVREAVRLGLAHITYSSPRLTADTGLLPQS